MPEPGRLISFAVAGEEASNALLDALSLLSWSGNALVQHEDAEAEEAGPLLQKEADPINGMDFYAPAAVAGGEADSTEITENEALALALALGQELQVGGSLVRGEDFTSSLRQLCSSFTLAECREVSGPAELMLWAVPWQILNRYKHCLVLDCADVEKGRIAKRLGAAVRAALQRPVVIVVNKATSFSEVFPNLSMPALLQDQLYRPVHVALLVTSQPYLGAVSQYRAVVEVEASSSLDVEVHWEPEQMHTFSLRLRLRQSPDSTTQVDVLRHDRPFTVSSLRSWIRDELRALFARDSWRNPPENWNAVNISFFDLAPPLLAGAEKLCVTDAAGQDAGMDVALLIASTVAQAGPLSTFCEEPGQTFSLQARAELDQGPSQAAVQVLHDKELEDEVPDDGIKSNQLAIATELVQRLLHIYFGQPHPDETKEKWFQRSLVALKKKFPKELVFVILTPSFKTLRQQTFDRLLKAGLAGAGNGDLVVPCIWAGKNTISDFYESARKCLDRLHVMVVDECHYAATLGQAHDAFVNEFKWQGADEDGVWGPCKGPECKRHQTAGATLDQENLVTLLVSATPYCVLSQQSRIEHVPLKDEPDNRMERNVVDWSLCLQDHLTHYWSIEKYLQTCHKTKQLQHAVICDHQFDIKLARARQNNFSGDHSLLVEYILSLEFFKYIRPIGQGHVESWDANQSKRVQDMLQEVQLILDPFALWPLAWLLLQMQVSPQLDWVRSEYEDVKRRPDITLPQDEQAAPLQQEGEQRQYSLPASPSMVLRLKLLFFHKLKGEKELHLRRGDKKADDEVFNQTDRIVKDLLTTAPDGTGSMVVIRVCSAAVGQEFAAIIKRFLELQSGTPRFECVGDFGSSDNQPLVNKMSEWAMQRGLSSSHPAQSMPDFAALSEAPGASLQTYLDWKSQALLSGAPAALQYGDLHGVPMMLVLCEKGRMGDTFPQTFRCLDLRLRTSENFTTFVQELGRLCRYPTATGSPHLLPSVRLNQAGHESCLRALKEALVYMYGRVVEVQWESWATAIALACSTQFAMLLRALNQQLAKHETASKALAEVAPAVNGLLGLPGADEEVEALAASGHPIRHLSRNCSAVQPDSDQPWPQDGHLLRKHLVTVRQSLLDWRQLVLDTLEATGFEHSDGSAAQLRSAGGAARLQLDGAYVQDVQDAQDLACAFLQPASSLRAAMQAGVDHQVQLIRFDHMVPYAVVKIKSHKQIKKAMDLQMAKHWGQNEAASDTILDNIPSAGQLDRFVDRAKDRIKGAVRGVEVHNYRVNYTAATTSYDNWGCNERPANWLMKRRLLLKAEPQVGKTGAYIAFLLRLKRVISFTEAVAPVMPPEDLERVTEWVKPGARLRWLHPFFEDMAVKWDLNYYGDVLSGRYAGKVALQRAMLLARACNTQSSSSWLAFYCQLMKGCEGENIQSRRGLDLIHELANSLKDQEKPMHVHGNQLFVDNSAIFKQAINWDKRLHQLMDTLRPQLDVGQSIQVEFDASGQIAVITVVSQSILEKLGDACMSGPRPLQHNVVQLLKWPSAVDDPAAGISSTAAVFARTDPLIKQPYMARSLQLARTFSSYPPAATDPELRMQEHAIIWQRRLTSADATDVWPAGPPKFWASDQALTSLRERGRLSAADDTGGITFERCAQGQQQAVANWIFVPSYRRYSISDPKQMLVDWSDAMKGMSYTRVIVVRSGGEQKGYCKMLEDYRQLQQQQQGEELHKHVTLLLELPPRIGVAAAAKLVGASADHLESPVPVELGIGYARLCAQLTAYFMGMDAAWLLDDNVQGCYRLSYEDLLQDAPQPPSRLQNIQIGGVMRALEDLVKHTVNRSACVASGPEPRDVPTLARAAGCPVRSGETGASPRSTKAERQGFTHINTVADWSGGWSNYGMLGVNQSFHRAHKVGIEYAPWKASHSLFSMVLMNVKATVEKGAFYPAKPYHEDIDFPHICNDHQLVAAKCQWLFVRKNFFCSPGQAASSQASPQPYFEHLPGDLYHGQIIKVQLTPERGEAPELTLGSTRVAPLLVRVDDDGMGHRSLACLESAAQPGLYRIVTDLSSSTGATVRYHGLEMFPWTDNHQVEVQQYMPDGLPVPHNLAAASRRAQLASIVHTVTRQRGGARVINVYESRYGAERGHLNAAELQGSIRRLEEVTEPSTSIFYFEDDPRLTLDVALDELRREVARLRATAVRHWLAIQAGQHRVNTADLAELQQAAYRGGWQLNEAWSTAPPGQCCTDMVEANSDDDRVQGVDLNPYLLLELRSSSADLKAPSRQSSGVRNDSSLPGSLEPSAAKPPGTPAKDNKRKAADVQEHQKERWKKKKQKRVHDDELDGKSPAGQDSGRQTPAGTEAGGGAGKTSQLTDAGGSGQVAGRPRALIRAELEKLRVATSVKSLAGALALTPKQVADNSRIRAGKKIEVTSADGVKTRKTVYTDFARDSDGNVLLRSWLVTYPTHQAPGNPVWFRILGLTVRHNLPWERAAGSAAVAPPQQTEDLDTRLLGELQHFGVVAQIVVRLDPSDTAWVKLVDVCASAEADLIMLGNNNNLQIERCSGPPV